MAAQPEPGLDPALERKLGVDLFNHVWRLLELEERTPQQTDAMIHAAHASAHHWRQVGAPVNFARSEWQCSRLYAVLGRPEPALWHARRCLELCEEQGIGDFDLAYAYEALARGHVVAGDTREAGRWLALAEEQAEQVADDADREHLRRDLATISLPSG